MKLSQYFTLDEFVVSEYAVRNDIPNIPSEFVIDNLQKLCTKILDPLREIIGKPIIITSGFRSLELNKAIGGSATSQHMTGQAADIIAPGLHADELFHAIIDANLPYDQLINEFKRWIHISYNEPPRKQKLIAFRESGKTVYVKA